MNTTISANNNRTNILKGVSTLDVTKMRIVLLFLAIIALGYGNDVNAARGHSILDRVDPKFSPRVESAAYVGKMVHYVKALPDGKTLVLGYFSSYNRIPVGRLVRLNQDGSLDQTFHNRTITSTQPSGDTASIVVQADGKILITSLDIIANGAAQKPLIRLDSDGTLDTTFNFALNSAVSDLTIDSLGRVVVAGQFTTPQGPRRVVRLAENGAIDTSFDFTLAGVNNPVVIAAQGDRIIIGASNSRIYRLNENGTEDTSFAPLTTAGSSVRSLIVQSDNKVLYVTDRLRRLQPNGGNDGSFQPVNLQGGDIKLTGDGKIVGQSSSTLRRYLPNGAVDSSFRAYTPMLMSCFEVQANGAVLVGDETNQNNATFSPNNFVRSTPAGSPDPGFNPGGLGFQNILPGSIRAIETQPNGKILLGGTFDVINNVPSIKLARLESDSAIDMTFKINTSGTGNHFSALRDIYQIRVQSDGKIVVSGSFDYLLNGIAKRNLVRLNTDGSIDTSFTLAHSMPDYSEIVLAGRNQFVIQSDGKIVVGTSKNSSSEVSGPVRLNTDGSIDTSFSPTLNNQSLQMFIDDLAIQADGKIVVSGSHRTVSVPFKSFVARLNGDGSTDQTFSSAQESGRLRSKIALLSDGSVLAARHSDGAGPGKLVKLNSNGSPDANFSMLTLDDGVINTLTVHPDGNIFVGGIFTLKIDGQPAGNLLQLSPDGYFESTVYDLDEEVLSLVMDNSRRVLVGGRFNVIGANGAGEWRSYVARLIDSTTPFDFDGDGMSDVGIFRPAEGTWYISLSSGDLSVSQWGIGTDKLVPADYDGDGKTDLGIYRNGQWWYFRSSDSQVAMSEWGTAGDIPMPSDFDGDGKADHVFFRPALGEWFRKGSTGVTDSIRFGMTGDIPLIGDFDGDGKSDPTIFRPSSGIIWYLSSMNGLHYAHPIGQSGDIPVLGDYDGDGKTDPAIFRGGYWLIINSSDDSVIQKQWGFADDHPAPADYDGDGITDIATYRPSNGMWFALRSRHGFFSQQFGLTHDRAVPNSFVF